MPRIFDGLLEHQRDHRIGIPLPATAHAPDACTRCHDDRDKTWAAHAARRWWGAPDAAALEAIEALERLRRGGSEADGTHDALDRALDQADPFFRAAAGRLLGEASSAWADPSPEVVLAAVGTAQRAGDQPLLRRLTTHAEVRVRAAAWVALETLGHPAPADAVGDLRRAARQVRRDTALRKTLARLDHAAGRVSAAARHLADAVVFAPDDVELWRLLAEAREASGDAAGAAAARQRATTLLKPRQERPR